MVDQYVRTVAEAASGYLLLKSLAAVPKLQPLCKLQVLCLVLYGLRRIRRARL